MTDQLPESTAAAASVRPSPRYVALLVGVALLVLVIGALLRPKAKPAPVVPTNELVSLPEHAQRKMLRDMAGFIAERTAAVASAVVYLPAVGASGLVLERDSALAVSAGDLWRDARDADVAIPTPVFLSYSTPDAATPASGQASVDSVLPRWGIVVARGMDGATLTLAGLIGGLVPVECGELILRELIFDAMVPAAFAGGGVFDLDGKALALAAPCGRRIALVPLADVARARERQRTDAYQLWARYGFRLAPSDSLVTAALDVVDSGLVVAELAIGGPADRAGLRPGDVVAPASIAADSADAIALLLTAPADHRLEVLRRNRTVSVAAVPPQQAASGVRLARERRPERRYERSAESGVTLVEVLAGSRAARAGLQAGDRVVQVDRQRRVSAAAVQRALGDTLPVFLVYERAGRRRGALLR